MCGFIGIVEANVKPRALEKKSQISKRISHRGPDGFGFVNDSLDSVNYFFSHYRLAIQGLGDGGNQPLIHDDLIILYNGEIYNYDELRNNLSSLYGIEFNTNCDTELIPWLYLEYGHEFVSYIKGMFSIVILDKKLEEVTFYRDFFGIKPLFYLLDENQVFFGSELNAFKDLNLEINNKAVNSFFLFSYNNSPESFFENVYELKKGTYLNISLGGMDAKEMKHVSWSPKIGLFESDSYTKILLTSVHAHLISDVPVAISLSGGFDSSILLYIAKQYLSKIKAYTIDFGYNYEDVNNAKIISNKFSVDLHIINARIEQINYFDLLNIIYEDISEPIADSAYIGTYLVSEAARKDGYRVILSGAGGDEIFGGYSRYTKFKKNSIFYYLNKLVKIFPQDFISPKFYNPFFHLLTNTSGCYYDLVRMGFDFRGSITSNIKRDSTYPTIVEMMEFDIDNYLVNDILKITDLASMKCGIESRVPFLDFDLLSNVRSNFIAEDYIFNQETKCKLKSDYRDVLPSSLYNMKKAGFGAPVDFIIESCRQKVIDYIKHREAMLNKFFPKIEYGSVSNNFLFHLFIYVKWKESFLVL
jgi:asparagine synthase (glutamine-hydrolysing)